MNNPSNLSLLQPATTARQSLLATAAAFSLALGLSGCILGMSRRSGPDVPPEVQAILRNVASTYRNLPAVSATLQVTDSSGGAARPTTVKMLLAKSAKLRVEVRSGGEVTHIVADGKTMFVDSSSDKAQYYKQPIDDYGVVGSELKSRVGPGAGILVSLMNRPRWESAFLPPGATEVVLLADQTVGDVVCEVIQVSFGTAPSSRRDVLAFGKEDHLVHRLIIGTVSDPSKTPIHFSYSEYNLHPVVAADPFTYTPLPGAVVIDVPASEGGFDPRLRVGAVPLRITGADLSGQAVALDQYQGKGGPDRLLGDVVRPLCGRTAQRHRRLQQVPRPGL